MSPKSAEIVKYAANAMLATKISFMNEIAALCDAAGGDVEPVRAALGADTRIGYPFLFPGLGFGGSCFPKDLRALVSTAREYGIACRMAEAATLANEEPVQRLLGYVEKALGHVAGKTIAVWGLAFKPGTDDVREAPALTLIEELVARGAIVRCTDPKARETARPRLSARALVGHVTIHEDAYETCRGADAVVIATEWPEYKNPDYALIKALLRGRHLFDGRNILLPDAVVEAGLVYRGMGRPEQGA
jgi:UDPglucose 6-dehydrogenase